MKQTERTELTVAKIMEAATEEFGTNGYAGGKINRICERGVSKGLLYHHFQGKDALYLACLRRSCETLLAMIGESCRGSELLCYMQNRMRFLRETPREAHIFFEALLQPQEHLRDRIREILQPFDACNEELYRSLLSAVTLRAGVTEEDAVAYFRQMQRMFNGCFGSSACRDTLPDGQILEHEMRLPKLLQFLLYGIAEGGGEA